MKNCGAKSINFLKYPYFCVSAGYKMAILFKKNDYEILYTPKEKHFGYVSVFKPVYFVC